MKNRQVSCYHRVDGIVGKICWYLMGRSHAILNVIIGGGGGGVVVWWWPTPVLHFQPNNHSQDDTHTLPDLSIWESCDVLKTLKVYDEI